MMQRVVITGMGITSCLGNDLNVVESALRGQVSGIALVPEYVELGMRSHVAGVPDISGEAPVDRKLRRFMGEAALYAYLAALRAIDQAGLDSGLLKSERTGAIVGSGTGSPYEHQLAIDTLRQRGLSKVPPYVVPRMMGSTTSACLATAFGIRGASYSLSSACASSAHSIGHAADLIRLGRQDVVLTGGAEEIRWPVSMLFDAMGALTTRYNDSTASRPYDATRDGFAIAGGAGILVLESLQHARQRKAHILAELVGYGACSDGEDMVAPAVEGAARVMRLALADAADRIERIDYINAHATSTPLGDISELEAIRQVFDTNPPLISSTKGLTGHPIGASAAHEAIYSILMLQKGFLAGCSHLQQPDPAIGDLPVLKSGREQQVDSIMSNSFGFGGSNASLIFKRYTERS